MIPRTLVGSAKIPGGGELRLMQRGAEFTLMIGATELMNSRRGGSEEALATLAAERLAGRKAPVVLIGGLGMGFTLKAALRSFPADARIVVAELVPDVIAWAKGPLEPVFAGSLADPRVTVHEGDVGELIRAGAARYDAILLDVDNSPDSLVSSANDALYTPAGLAAARKALRLGGIFAVWSADHSNTFTRRLRDARFVVEEVTARSGGNKGAKHVIWVARRV